MAIVCVGLACYDEFFYLDELPKENEKTFSSRFFESGGGPATNASYLTASWGLETYLLTSLGKDIYGKLILRDLEAVGVNTSYAVCNTQQITPLATVWVDQRSGSRTVVTHRHEGAKHYSEQDYARIDQLISRLNATKQTHIVLVDGHEPELSLYLIQGLENKVVVMDGGSIKPRMLTVLPHVNYAIVSANYAETLLRRPLDEHNYIFALSELKKVIAPGGVPMITLGEKGGVYFSNFNYCKFASLKVKAIDTTGAGDIFHGAFCYGLAKGFNIENCCKLASVTSALSVQKIGVQQAIPSIKEVLEVLKNKVELQE